MNGPHAISNQLKALREKTAVPWERSLPADCFWTQDCNIHSSLVSCLPACPTDSGVASLYNSMSLFLKINFKISISVFLSVSLHIYKTVGSIALEDPNKSVINFYIFIIIQYQWDTNIQLSVCLTKYFGRELFSGRAWVLNLFCDIRWSHFPVMEIKRVADQQRICPVITHVWNQDSYHCLVLTCMHCSALHAVLKKLRISQLLLGKQYWDRILLFHEMAQLG